MEIQRNASLPMKVDPDAWFTGAVSIENPFQALEPARVGGATVTFQPGARTAWHTHPLGQTLVVIAGQGLAQTEGRPAQCIGPGDVVWFSPEEKHWHGATATDSLTHVAIAERANGVSVVWLEQVSEGQYESANQDIPSSDP